MPNMVKRIEYGFNGLQVPTIPRAPRSARRGSLKRKKAEDNEICPFELLASLAGKLLQESESSSASSNASGGNSQSAFDKDIVKQEGEDEAKLFKAARSEHRCSEESAFVSEITSQNIDQKFIMKEFPYAVSERTSNKSDLLDKVVGDVKSIICDTKPAFENYPFDVEKGSLHTEESSQVNVENGIERQRKEGLETRGLTITNTCSPKDLKKCVPNASFSRHRNGIKLGSRDDDENFSWCNKRSSKIKGYRPPARIGDSRIRKLLTSKYWKAAPKLRDCEVFRSDGGMRHLYNKRKSCYTRDRYQIDAPYKRRKLFDRSSVVMSDGGFSSESVSNSPQKGTSGDINCSGGMLRGVTSRQASFNSKDSHVKFSIKSFRVPELYIEVPETATVGSLKRTVMEAVTAILEGELHVGVLLQGKKIRDDNRTLMQTGILCKDNLDTLGFILEPNALQASPSMCANDPHPSLSCDMPQLITGSPGTPVLESGMPDALPEPPLPLTISETHVDSNHESISSHTGSLTENITPDSRALVVVPPVAEALAVVPLNSKNRKSELAQRRTRRPFSVSEVEALVQAVEGLGTGRWRDVKLRAFENADHRTYVDLKDKWKTLVHTARIAPQQRRGEPVPQELLDRVLAAHAYWSQHQAKQHGKLQVGTVKIADAPADKLGGEGNHSS